MGGGPEQLQAAGPLELPHPPNWAPHADKLRCGSSITARRCASATTGLRELDDDGDNLLIALAARLAAEASTRRRADAGV